MFRHVSDRVVLPASRKFAEDSRKGEAEGDFWSKEYWTTLRSFQVFLSAFLASQTEK